MADINEFFKPADEVLDEHPQLRMICRIGVKEISILVKSGLLIGYYDTTLRMPRIHPISIEVLLKYVEFNHNLQKHMLRSNKPPANIIFTFTEDD